MDREPGARGGGYYMEAVRGGGAQGVQFPETPSYLDTGSEEGVPERYSPEGQGGRNGGRAFWAEPK